MCRFPLYTKFYLINSVLYIILLLIISPIYSQKTYNKTFLITKDTLYVDSLSLNPEKTFVKGIDSGTYFINYSRAQIIILKPRVFGKIISVTYTLLPFSLEKKYFHKIYNPLNKERTSYRYDFKEFDIQRKKTKKLFDFGGLSKNGSISRGISFGDARNLAVNSSLNLELSGKIYNDINISASISDANIPIQAEGNTKLLNEFDRIFITINKNKTSLTAGDFIIYNPENKYINFTKKTQGGIIRTQKKLNNGNQILLTGGAGISKGKFKRQTFMGIEGNQGPYKLQGSNNEAFITILSGTEKVYVDGKLLQRGENYDYTIDYNNASIIFTPNFLITKDKRIYVDFEYSDKNYTRTLITGSIAYKTEKSKTKINYFSQQDLKSQPLQQELNENEKKIIADVGDSITKATTSRFRKSEFTENQVLYKKIDTLGFKNIFKHVTQTIEDSLYSVSFSETKPNKGNYILKEVTGIGKIYEWKAPVNGIQQGNFSPQTLLITPKKNEMLGFKTNYQVSNTLKLKLEGAISNFDVNTFSSKQKSNDLGFVYNLGFDKLFYLNNSKSDSSWHIIFSLNFKELNKNYKEFLPHREVEFFRNYSINNYQFTTNQYETNNSISIQSNKNSFITYQLKTLQDLSNYSAFNHQLKILLHPIKKINLNGYSSLLKTKSILNSTFIKNNYNLDYKIKKIKLGVHLLAEENKITHTDSSNIDKRSISFLSYTGKIAYMGKNDNQISFSYTKRTDKVPFKEQLIDLSSANSYNFSSSLYILKNHSIKSTITYRDLLVKADSNLTQLKNTKSTLIRVNYQSTWFSKIITSNTLYQIGSGKEQKEQETFIKVNTGSGTHTYVGDIDKDNIKDFDEFVISKNLDQADYIKIRLPTNELINVFNNEFTENLFLNFQNAFKKNKSSFLIGFLSKISNKTNYSLSQKVDNNKHIFNPFYKYNGTNLITINEYFYNVLSFNRNNIIYGVDLILSENRNKSILVNGFQEKITQIEELKFRWNVTKKYLLKTSINQKLRISNSAFENNRYKVQSNHLESSLTYQPNINIRSKLISKLGVSKNAQELGGQNLKSTDIGIEFKFSKPKIGLLTTNINYIMLDYISQTNNPTFDYEILNGLTAGKNITWSLDYRQNLSKNIQITLSYNGRKPEKTNSIHYGNIQIKAFF